MQEYTEKEILSDGLCSQKNATNLYNMAANECMHAAMRETMRNLLEEEHNLQEDVFDMMHEKGYYPTPVAEEKKIQDVKQRFAQSIK